MRFLEINQSTIQKFAHTVPVPNLLTTKIMTEKPKYFHKYDILDLSEKSHSKPIGLLPKELLGLFPDKPHQALEFLDELSGLLRVSNPRDKRFPSEGLNKLFSIKYKRNFLGIKTQKNLEITLASGKKINIKYLGYGVAGRAFKIKTPDNKAFVLKAFHFKGYAMQEHGAYGEIAAGAYSGGKKYRDIAQFHIGNPEQGWMLSEYIGLKDNPIFRKGPSIEDRLVLMDKDGNQNKFGVMYEYGGAFPRKNIPKKYTK